MINHENKKDNVVFIHANGFPPASYDNILENLKNNYEVDNFLLRPLWKEISDYRNLKSWEIFCEDFEKFLNNSKTKKNIGIGHSIGGNIILHTAIKKPDFFSKIILLDPTLFPPKIIFVWKLLNMFNLQDKFLNLSKSAKNKKMHYKSYNELYNNYRKKEIFKLINDENLKLYIDSIIKINEDKSIDITYSNHWERTIYNKGLLKDNYIWENINNLQIPCLIIRAHKSTALPLSSIKKIKKKNKFIKIETMTNVTHLFPFEQPEIVTKKINNFI